MHLLGSHRFIASGINHRVLNHFQAHCHLPFRTAGLGVQLQGKLGKVAHLDVKDLVDQSCVSYGRLVDHQALGRMTA
jgi:hypothetical protein